MSPTITGWLDQIEAYIAQLLHNSGFLLNIGTQVAIIFVSLSLPRLFGARVQTVLQAQTPRLTAWPAFQSMSPERMAKVATTVIQFAPWAPPLAALWTATLAFREAGEPAELVNLAGNLALVWVVIRASSSLVKSSTLASVIAIAAWIFAALNIVGWLDPMMHLLDSMGVTFGSFRLSVLRLIRGTLVLISLTWLANVAGQVLEHRLHAMSTLAPAVQVLATKLARLALFTVAVAMAMNSVGIDLTALAVFSGAIGVGIGFGLQKVASNLISGVILLLDRSIKPGDIIDLGGSTGWITRLNARFVSVATPDGIEHLIPNEDLITRKVVNWTHSTDQIRVHIPVGISYASDPRKAIRLCAEAATGAKSVLDSPAPSCVVSKFGDSAIELDIRVWAKASKEGVSSMRSDVLLRVWDKFRENGIELPFPQHDIHFPEFDRLVGTAVSAMNGRRPWRGNGGDTQNDGLSPAL